MNYVIMDKTFSFDNILNFPFALGSAGRKYETNDEAIDEMMNGRVVQAEHRHREALRELIIAIEGPATGSTDTETVERLDHVFRTDDILIYEPVIHHDHPEDLMGPNLAIRLPADDRADETTLAFWEHPALTNVSGWWFKGRYYGYPDCCISMFIRRARGQVTQERFHAIGEHSKEFPCIVCDHHARTDPAEYLKEVNERRRAQYAYEPAASLADAKDRMSEQLHYLLELQRGNLTAKYNLE